MVEINRLASFAAPLLEPEPPRPRPAARMDGLALLFGDDDADLVPVQEGGAGARRQPGPINQDALRPGGSPSQRRQAPAPVQRATPSEGPQQPAPPVNGVDLLFGDPAQPARPEPQINPRLARQRRGGDARGAVQRYLEGNKDPAYAGIGGFRDVDLASSDNPDVDASSIYRAQMVAPNDQAYADIIKNQLGPAFVRMDQDQHGQSVVVFRDRAGGEQKRYINEPGLDWQDVQRGVLGAVPYMVSGGLVGGVQRGAGILSNVLGQGAAAGATSLAANAASRVEGSNAPVDLTQTAVMTAAGAAAPLLGRAVGSVDRAQRQVPGLVDDAGALTAKGAELARRAGIDPDALTGNAAREFAQTYAKTKNAAESAIRGTTAEFDIPISRGQLTKDPHDLLLEKAYRNSLYGGESREVMKTFDDAQREAIAGAALGRPNGTSIGGMLNPSRGLTDQTPDVLGGSIQAGVRSAKSEGSTVASRAFKDAGDAVASPEALKTLPSAIQNQLGSFRVSDKLTPTADDMGKQIKAFMEGKAPGNSVPEVFGGGSVPNVDEFRKQLFKTYQGASPGADKEAARRIYAGYDDWLKQSSDGALLAGDVAFAAKNRIARDAYRSVREAFEPTEGGKKLPAANVIAKSIREGTSATEVVQTLFGAPGLKSAPKEGTVQALKNIKGALDKWGDGKGGARSQTWDDIRLAFWMQKVTDKQGVVLTPQVMLNNIQNAMRSQNEVMAMLYSKEEMSAIVRFATALRAAAWKDPNPSGTATALGVLSKDVVTTLLKAIGWQGSGATGLLASSAVVPLRNVVGAQGARRATRNAPSATIDPNVSPYTNALMQGGLRTDLGGQPYAD